MKKTITAGSQKSLRPVPTGLTPAQLHDANAERRRTSLQSIMKEREATPTDVARMIGMPTPNALYNFLQGKAASLSLDAVERILAAYPEITFEELVGLPPRRPPIAAGPEDGVVVTIEANAGAWRRRPDLPAGRRMNVACPDGFRPTHADSFAVQSQDVSADLLYPLGTLLICRPVPVLREDAPAGCGIIVRRAREGRHETTVRELKWQGEHAWLCPRSSRLEHQAPQRVRPPLVGPIPGLRGEAISVVGVVFASLQRERITALK